MKKIITLVFCAIGLTSINAQTVIFSEDFESGTLNTFTSNTTSGTLTWQTTTNRGTDPGHSSSNSAYFGDPLLFNYSTGNQEGAEITSSVINLNGYTYAYLTLNYFLETENSVSYDIATVEISTDGVTFSILADNNGSGLLQDGTGSWQPLALDLSAFAGGNLYLRFSLNTVDNISNSFEGFYVDDIVVKAVNANTSFVYNKTIGSTSDEKIRGASVTSDGGLIMVGDFNASIPNSIVYKTNIIGDTSWTRNLINYNQSAFSFKNVEQASDGSYVVSGIVGGGGGSGAVGTQDMCILKLGSNGGYLWSNGYGDAEFAEDVNSAGARIVSGGNMLIYGNISRINASVITTEAGVIKTNAAGNILWSRAFEYKQSDLIDIVEMTSGEIVTIGGDLGGDWQSIYCLDASGNPLWFTNVPMDTVARIKELSSGEILICGGDMDNGGNMDAAIVTMDLSGNITSYHKYGSVNFSEIGKDILASIGGGYAMVVADNSTGTQKMGLYKLDANWNLEWARAYGGTLPSDPVYVVQFSIGDFLIAGNTTTFGQGGYDAYLVRTNSNGITVGCQEELTNILHTISTEGYSPFTFNTLSGALSGSYNGVSASTDAVYIQDVYPTTAIAASNPLCNGGTGGAVVTPNGGVNPFSYLWSSGIASQTLTGASAGTYTVIVTDNNGCVVHDTTTLSEPTVITASLTAVDVDCFANFNGAVDLTVSGGTPGYSYQWANGATTEDISGVGGGFYQVTISDNNGCQSLQGISVFEPGPLNAGISSSQNISCFGMCDGTATAIANGGTSPYSYSWNDASSQNILTATNLCEGAYLVTVTDNNGCSAFANTFIIEPDQLTASIATTTSDCGAATGTATANVSGGTGTLSYLWSSGGNANVENGLNPGSYSLDVTDNNGCTMFESFSISSYTTPVEICVITVDSTSTKNVIAWEKPIAGNVDGFYVYRNIVGAYSQIGYVPYDSLSVFTDNSFGIDPNVTSYRYKISVLDTCGNESDLSSFHETIHLSVNTGNSGEVNLIWDNYEGFNFNYYRILRDSTGSNNWEVLDSVGNTSFIWTDNNVPTTGADYLIEIVMDSTCTATKAQTFGNTRSNRRSSVGPNGPTSIDELILSAVAIYPNPNNGIFTIQLQSDNWEYSLYDMSGKLISSEFISETNATINMETVETGIYMIRVDVGDSFIYKKIVKQ